MTPTMDLRRIFNTAEPTSEGHWTGADAPVVSYPPDGYDDCFAVEDRSYWFQHRNAVLVELARRFPPPDGIVLDVGGGNGCVTRAFQDAGFASILLEPAPAGVSNAHARGVALRVCGTTETAGLADRSVGGIGVFDVVEHIEDDRAFVERLGRALMPGGYLYVTVPAFAWLWSDEDRVAGHFRRYRLDELERLLRSEGFDVVFASYLFRPLPPAILLGRVLRRKAPTEPAERRRQMIADHVLPGAPGRIMRRLLVRELERIRQGQPMRFGSSCLAVARRSS